MAKVRIAVVVKNSPSAAVAVNSEKFIFKNNFINNNYLLRFSCIRNYF